LFYAIPQMSNGECSTFSKAVEAIWKESLQFLQDRRDCSDFVLHAALRLLRLTDEPGLLTQEKRRDLQEAICSFVYWRDEQAFHPGHLLTENHQIMFHSAELLAGEMLPDEFFPSLGLAGRVHRKRGRERVLRWIDWRMRFGFSEWLSQHYLEENLVPLLNLHQFSQDQEVREKARVLLDLMVFEMAVNSFQGSYCASQGRTYAEAVLNHELSVTSPVRYLLWGTGAMDQRLSMSAICLATSDYEAPALLEAIAFDGRPEMSNRQRCSLTYQEALDFGIDPRIEENYPLFVSLGYQFSPAFMPHSVRYLNPERWEGKNVRRYLEDPSLMPAEGDLPTEPFVYPRVHPSSFRTPDFFLSCANDWCKGHRGYQHHIWNAKLPGKAAVFTNCPNDIPRTGRWAGNAYLPRAVAFRNVLVCLYQPPEGIESKDSRIDPLESHAWFPTFLFDEVLEREGWIFGRKETGFVALRSLEAGSWVEPDPAFLASVGYGAFESERYDFSSSARNVWICELGNPSIHGNFGGFVGALSRTHFSGGTECMVYDSPSVGRIEFGWDLPFFVNGHEVSPVCEKRFINPYCEAEFGIGHYEILKEGEAGLVLK
jgi:hypothetical protein